MEENIPLEPHDRYKYDSDGRRDLRGQQYYDSDYQESTPSHESRQYLKKRPEEKREKERRRREREKRRQRKKVFDEDDEYSRREREYQKQKEKERQELISSFKKPKENIRLATKEEMQKEQQEIEQQRQQETDLQKHQREAYARQEAQRQREQEENAQRQREQEENAQRQREEFAKVEQEKLEQQRLYEEKQERAKQRTQKREQEKKRQQAEKIEMENLRRQEEKRRKAQNHDMEEIVDRITNPELRNRVQLYLGTLDSQDESSNEEKIKNGLLVAIEKNILMDHLDDPSWSGFLISDEVKKFRWEQQVTIINDTISDENILLDRNNKKLYEFCDAYLKPTYSEKRNELNGFEYKGKKIIKRNKQGEFERIDSPTLNEFIQLSLKIQSNSAESILKGHLNSDNTREVKAVANEYIRALRNEQSQLIRDKEDTVSVVSQLPEINNIEDEIQHIRFNRKFKIRLVVWGNTFSSLLARFYRTLRVHQKKIILGLGWLGFSIGSVVVSIIEGKNMLSNYTHHVKQVIQGTFHAVKTTLEKTVQGLRYLETLIPMSLRGVSEMGSALSLVITIVLYLAHASLLFIVSSTLVTFTTFLIATDVHRAAIHGLADFIHYAGIKWDEGSYLSVDKNPPEEIIDTITKKESISREEYLKSIQPLKVKNPSPIRKAWSYIQSLIGSGLKTTGNVVHWSGSIVKSLPAILVLIIIILVLYKFL